MNKYDNFEIDRMLESMEIVIDTREQINDKYQRRIKQFTKPAVREKLPYGDYSCRYTDIDGNVISMANVLAIERKLGADELAMCFTTERDRFEREMERVKADNAQLILLTEGTSIDKIMAGEYRSKLNPASLIASIMAWTFRYFLILIFCTAGNSGTVIQKLLHYGLKEHLATIQEEDAA